MYTGNWYSVYMQAYIDVIPKTNLRNSLNQFEEFRPWSYCWVFPHFDSGIPRGNPARFSAHGPDQSYANRVCDMISEQDPRGRIRWVIDFPGDDAFVPFLDTEVKITPDEKLKTGGTTTLTQHC